MVSIFGIVKTNMSVPDNDWGEFRLLPSYNFLYFETQINCFSQTRQIILSEIKAKDAD